MMSETDTQAELLPLGSIVKVEGTERKLMIVGRALAVPSDDGRQVLYDYGAVVYPFGILGDALVYTNHEEIAEVVFEGFSDAEDDEMRASIAEALKTIDIPRAEPRAAQSEPDTW